MGSFEDLSPEDRKILVLKIVKGLSWKSIADRLDIRHDAARKRGERALKRLRERFFQ
ncbi:sigma factor-like helix-turn-helix DNA-binding protein [Moorena sp. SIO3B2]|uniref:sigma factor-like helix-turn-helix DNA-binding protein n=1 Tax=Moorena sp. SIO3B2 TaxID=2607827 RepID=UPI00338D9918